MTHQEKIEAIRAKCIAVNPEIVELKEGCQSEDEHGVWIKSNDGWFMPSQPRSSYAGSPPGRILGRPIRLADVIALGKKVGYATTETWLKLLGYLVDAWNLRADDLTLQSEKCIDFIHELVK